MGIVWLASYPKSGNTWVRAVLTAYLRADDAPASINALIARPIASDRDAFDEALGLESSDMTQDEVLRYRPLFHAVLAEELSSPAFVKTHDAYLRLPCGATLFPESATSGAVYLVRNPLDLAVSYAHHSNVSIDDTVRWMDDPAAAESSHFASGIFALLPELLTSWSGHVASWLDQEEVPLHVARYEDLLADPHAAFGRIVRFAGLEWDAARLARAIDRSAFPRLRAQETESGFREKQPTAPSFFRAGVAGSWRTTLSPRQVRALVDTHGPMMERLGYLREAEEFLAARCGSAEAAAR